MSGSLVSPRMLGLPDRVRRCLFDLDGVLTQTATLHAAAWKERFDAYLRSRAQATGERFEPFDAGDYDRYVDGKRRADPVRPFPRSRGIELADGAPDDPPDQETVAGLGDRENEIVLRLIRERAWRRTTDPRATSTRRRRRGSAARSCPRHQLPGCPGGRLD